MSPTLGCSVDISRDIIYIYYMYVGLSMGNPKIHMPECVGRIT